MLRIGDSYLHTIGYSYLTIYNSEDVWTFQSYKLVIRYLCDYLKISQFDKESIAKIENTANVLKDYNSSTYEEVLAFLTKRRQLSYLLKGWINAGVNQFIRFMN